MPSLGHAREGVDKLAQVRDDLGARFSLGQLSHALLDERQRAQAEGEDGPRCQLLQGGDDDGPRRLEAGWIQSHGGACVDVRWGRILAQLS